MSGWDTWGLPPFIDWSQIMYSAIRPESFPGCDPTGQSDSTSAIVAARAAALSAQAPLWLEGQYLISSTQFLQGSIGSGQGEWLHLPRPSSRIIANFNGSMFTTNGFATPTKQNDIRITGPGKIGRSSIGQTGDILHFYGDRFTMLETVIDTFSQGRAFYGGGDHHFIWKVKAQNNDGQISTGGWRFAVGNYSRMIGLDISSGDDALQLVPEGSSANSMFNVGDITHTYYEHCVGQSAAARGIAVLFIAGGGSQGQMSTNIMHSGFRDCDLIGNARGLVIENLDSYGMIFDLLLSGCRFDMTGAQTTFDADALVWENPANAAFFSGHVLGPLRQITLEDLAVTNPVATVAPLRVIGATESVNIVRPTLVMPSSASTAIMDLTGGTSIHVRDGYLDMAGQAHPCILGGQGGTLTADIQIDGTRVVGLASSQIAFNMNAVTTPKISHTKTEIFAGATAVVGARTGATTTNARIRDNDWAATPTLTDTGTGTQHTGNVGLAD